MCTYTVNKRRTLRAGASWFAKTNRAWAHKQSMKTAINTVIFTYKRESEILERKTYVKKSNWLKCLHKLLSKEYKKFMKKNKYSPIARFTYKQSDVRHAEVDGVMSNLLTVYLPG